jgi:glycosyltransferase involved in cell wall biosynthesis
MSKRVLAINGRFLTQRMTGVQRYAWEAVKAIDALLQTPEFADLRGKVELLVPNTYDGDPGLVAIRLVRCGRRGGYFWEQLELPFLAAGKVLLGLCGLGPVFHSRQVLVVHDVTYLAVPQTFRPVLRRVYGFLVPVLVRRAARLIAVSEFTRQELEKYLGADPGRITVCGESGEHMLAEPASTSALDRNNLAGANYFIAVGVGGANKNFSVLLAAFRAAQLDGALLVLTGKRNPRVHADTGIEQDAAVRYIGYVSESELRGLYERALALVYPSSYEGFGLPPLEAMNCGCPTITSDQGALLEVANGAGLHFPVQDAAALARLMERVAGDSALRADLSARGRARAEDFRWHDVAARLLRSCRPLQQD